VTSVSDLPSMPFTLSPLYDSSVMSFNTEFPAGEYPLTRQFVAARQ
jgi:hypothetical protein